MKRILCFTGVVLFLTAATGCNKEVELEKLAIITTPDEYCKEFNDADLIVGDADNFYVEATRVNWVVELDLQDAAPVAAVKRTGITAEFEPWDATVLPAGTSISQHNSEETVLIADRDGEPIPYLLYNTDGGEFNLENTDLASSLNEKYLTQGQKLYNEFMEKVGSGIENISLQSEYVIKANNGVTVSIEHSILETSASGFQRYEYDTIDVRNELYITLNSLFVDDTYIDVISAEIAHQMETQMAEDDTIVYFTGDDGFTKITAEQQFYIDNSNHLVIVFDEYAVAPGYMGSIAFTIPTEKISHILVGSQYIK